MRSASCLYGSRLMRLVAVDRQPDAARAVTPRDKRASPAPDLLRHQPRVGNRAMARALLQRYRAERVGADHHSAAHAVAYRGSNAVGGRNVATIALEDGRHVTCASIPPGAPGVQPAHSEVVAWAAAAPHITATNRVEWVYTERAPCGNAAGHRNCQAFLDQQLNAHGRHGANTRVYFTHEYPAARELLVVVIAMREIAEMDPDDIPAGLGSLHAAVSGIPWEKIEAADLWDIALDLQTMFAQGALQELKRKPPKKKLSEAKEQRGYQSEESDESEESEESEERETRRSRATRPGPPKRRARSRSRSRERERESRRRDRSPPRRREIDLDLDEIPGIGRVQNVAGSGMNCLIRALLLGATGSVNETTVRALRDHLRAQNVAEHDDMLDLLGAAGGVLISELVARGLLGARRGLVVWTLTRYGRATRRTVIAGVNPIALFFEGAHFRTVIS